MDGRHAATPRSWRSTWAALALTLAARSVLSVLTALVMWSVLPAALGWHTTVVMSGSMMPRLHVGDLVVSRPVPQDSVRPGQVLLFEDPDHAGRLRLHRLTKLGPDGTLTTRGDANARADSTPVRRSAVRGVAALHIPHLGLPVYWSQTRQYGKVAASAATFALLLAATRTFRSTPIGTPDPTESPRESVRKDPVTRPKTWRTRFVTSSAVVVVLVGSCTVFANPARAGTYKAGATNTGDSWSAATYFGCAGAESADGARFVWPMTETSGTNANDATAYNYDGTYTGTISYGATGPCNNKTGVTLNGTNAYVTPVSTAATSGNANLSLEIWFKATGTHGGILESVTSVSGGTATTTAALAMNTNGTLILAISASGTKSISTTKAYNDNAWHLAVGVIGSGGMALYVDTASPVTSTAVTSASTASGIPRVGYGNHSSLSTGSYDYFQGSVANAAAYLTSLSATQVSTHYAQK